MSIIWEYAKDIIGPILSQQWFWGIILGAVLTYFSQWLQKIRQQKVEQKIASMQIATLFRSWLANCDSAVLGHQNWESTGGEMGKMLSKIPELNIEQSLDQIVRLKPSEAKEIFEWIQKIKDAERTYSYMLDVDGEIATDQLLDDCGVLFNSGLNIYNTLAAIVGWEPSPFSVHAIQRMTSLKVGSRRTAERAEES